MDQFVSKKRKAIYSSKHGSPPKYTTKKYSHRKVATLRPPRRIGSSSDSPACLFSHDIFFCVDELNDRVEDDGICWSRARWFSLKIDGSRKPLIPFWKGKVPSGGGLAVLGSHIYSFGGMSYAQSRRPIRDGYKLRVTPHVSKELVSIPPMLSRRCYLDVSVLRTKIYVRNDDFHHRHFRHQWGEVFDPAKGKWEALPNPPNFPSAYPECICISAALESPERILVAYHTKDDKRSAIFYSYDVQHRTWGMLAPAKRKLHRLCDTRWRERAISVGNTLFWIERHEDEVFKDDILFIAYDLDLDLWLEGTLKEHGVFFFQDYGILGTEARHPGFLHLEKHKFCLLQCAYNDYLRCVIVEISPMPQTKSLGISVVWDQKYAMEPKKSPGSPTVLVYCDIMPKKTDLEKKSSKKEVRRGDV
ncbi:uncharacterized protein LOC133861636 [Alnus glutinosa]|uniref:uncharacterized protein LOC133861636 n=1 Tax=Alnus glutinosa TaxID=3517 RepID=UPI002D789782|nr:uncharacterized protein LOC133861636 [Alnus glutinosa]